MSSSSTIKGARSLIKLSSSHRTIPEQLVGLGIYLLASFLLFASLRFFPFPSAAISDLTYQILSFTHLLSWGVSMWLLWRAHSLRKSKLELSLFLAQFLFLISWCITCSTGAMLLAMAVLLLLWCNTLIAAVLYWKKEKISGVFLVFPILWIFYLAVLNMLLC
jgi:tryptophan-rich sensory protein